jgi:predicted MFS family arabinose efflux permease
MIVGPVVGGALAGFGLLVPLFFAAGLTGLSALAIWRFLPQAPRPLAGRNVRRKLRFTDPRLRHYLLASFGAFVGFSGIQQTLGFRLQDSLALSNTETAQYTGIALMVSAGCTFLMQLLVAQRLKSTAQRLMQVGLGALLVGTLLIAASHGFHALLVGMGFLGAGIGLLVPAVASGASLAVTQEEQGGAAGLVTACPAAGFVVGPVAAGALYTVHPALAPSGAALVVLVVLMMSLRQRPTSVSESAPD